jgi:hypothetical protein
VVYPRILAAEEIVRLPDPASVPCGDPQEWSHVLETALTGEYALFSLPETYRFIRPNPYHAGIAIAKAAVGESLTENEENLLMTQAMRVWGLWMAQGKWDGTLLLRGGRTADVTALLTYLDRSKGLSRIVWIPDSPAEAGEVSGLYPDVGTGVDLSACRTEEEQMLLGTYAEVAPIGRAVAIRLLESGAPRRDPVSL